MKSAISIPRSILIAVWAVLSVATFPAGADAEASDPVWSVGQQILPTNLEAGKSGVLKVGIENMGPVETSGTITLTDELPAGLVATGISPNSGQSWNCPGVAGATTVICTVLVGSVSPTYSPNVMPHAEGRPLIIEVQVEPGVTALGDNTVTVAGGGAPLAASSAQSLTLSPIPAPFGIDTFRGWRTNLDGSPGTTAGTHPDVTTEITFNTATVGSLPGPPLNTKDVYVQLPPGLVGNPTAVPYCEAAELDDSSKSPTCPPNTQVGFAEVPVSNSGISSNSVGVYNIRPPKGSPARFGFNVAGVITNIDPVVRTGTDYGITAKVTSASQSLPVIGTRLTIWGVPADPIHDVLRIQPRPEFGPLQGVPSTAPRVPLLSAPTACPGVAETTRVSITAWNDNATDEATTNVDSSGDPAILEGCDSLAFDPDFKVWNEPATGAGAPAALAMKLSLPQNEQPEGRATSHLRNAVVNLPDGMGVNPSSAQGLQSCSPAQVDLGGSGPANCPQAAKIGSVAIDTPLLDEDLSGGLYLAAQKDNPFGSTLAAYLVAEGSGVVVKVPGKIEADPRTGRLTASFTDSPQLPFETLTIRLNAGPRAPLTMPATCGPATTTAVLTPWSGTAPVTVSSTFQVGPGAGGCDSSGFNPKLSAGTTNPIAGAFSPFVLQLTRGEGEAQLGSIQSLNPPKGLLASLKGVPYCPDVALLGISGEEGTGQGQISSPSCPAASQVGTTTVGAGAGPDPFYTDTGRVYLAGPYKGAPLSLAAVVPAVAGPFDLGSVVVRNALKIDPETAQITVQSDPFPQILHGIPLDLRDIRVTVDRKDFTINPTSCDPTEVTSTIAAVGGKTASPSSRFQVANCERLAFKPKLKLSVKGPTHRNAHPAFKAVLTMPQGGANIQRAQVTLPKTELLENAHIRTICTRVQYNAGAGGGANCPAASIYGKAKAWTPLLDEPLQGPVYLRSSSHQLPDLVASLDGQIHIDLVGRIDAKKARIRNTFEGVPDAPVSRFVLQMQGGKKGLLANNTELCRTTPRALAKFDGQNGKIADSNPVMRADCGKKARKGARKHRR